MSLVLLPFKGRWSIWQEIIQIEDGHSVNTVVAFTKIDGKIVLLYTTSQWDNALKSRVGTVGEGEPGPTPYLSELSHYHGLFHRKVIYIFNFLNFLKTVLSELWFWFELSYPFFFSR